MVLISILVFSIAIKNTTTVLFFFFFFIMVKKQKNEWTEKYTDLVGTDSLVVVINDKKDISTSSITVCIC